jgi:hypothetical protein
VCVVGGIIPMRKVETAIQEDSMNENESNNNKKQKQNKNPEKLS